MTVLILIVLIFLCMPLSARADITTGLVGYWKFDEGSGTTAADASGNNNTGTLVNGPTFAAGKSGKGLTFNGTNQEITTTNNIGNPGPFTLSVWFKATSAFGHKIIGLEDQQTGTGSGIYDRHLYMRNDGKIAFGVYDTAPRIVTSSTALVDGNWHHAAGTNDGTTSTLYIDGVSQGTVAGAGYSGYGSSYWRIAGYQATSNWASGSSGYFKGSLDDVRIYNRALTAGDVAELYQKNAVPKDGLVAWWTFDEGPLTSAACGNCVRDPIGNNTGTLSGAAKPTFVTGKNGKALSFDGSIIPYVSLGSADGLNLQNAAFSVSAWVKTNGQPTSAGDKNQPVISRQNGSGGTTYAYLFRLTSTFVPEMALWDGAHGVSAQGSALIPGSWYHIVSVYDGANLQVFVNGVGGTGAAKGSYTNPSYTSSPAYIGAWAAQVGARGHFNGLIDDVRVYNRALSAAEVAALYRAGSGPAVRGFNKIKGAARIKF